MPTEFSDAALQEADAAIKATQAYQPSKGEKVFNKIGESYICVFSNAELVRFSFALDRKRRARREHQI